MRIESISVGVKIPCPCRDGKVVKIDWSSLSYCYIVLCKCGKKHYFSVGGQER